jgi:hypothetical protein
MWSKCIVLYSVSGMGSCGLSTADFICHSCPITSLLLEYEMCLPAVRLFVTVRCVQQSVLPDPIRGSIFGLAVIVSCLVVPCWLIMILLSSLLCCQECLVIGLKRWSLHYHVEMHTPRRICHVQLLSLIGNMLSFSVIICVDRLVYSLF